MAEGIVDLITRRKAKAEADTNEALALRAHVDAMLECNAILANAIEQMWDFAERAEIVKALRGAAGTLECHED
ncbi:MULTISPECIES: hypothetical protein [unclassified Bradyrhizobium]